MQICCLKIWRSNYIMPLIVLYYVPYSWILVYIFLKCTFLCRVWFDCCFNICRVLVYLPKKGWARHQHYDLSKHFYISLTNQNSEFRIPYISFLFLQRILTKWPILFDVRFDNISIISIQPSNKIIKQ